MHKSSMYNPHISCPYQVIKRYMNSAMSTLEPILEVSQMRSLKMRNFSMDKYAFKAFLSEDGMVASMTINLYPNIICHKGNVNILLVLVWKYTYSQVVYQKKKNKQTKFDSKH